MSGHPRTATSSTLADRLQRDITSWLHDRDEGAARRLIDDLHPQVIRIVRNHVPRGMDEEDLVQDVFVRLLAQLHRYDPNRPIENWVSRLALNVCRNAFRGRSRRPELRWADLSEAERATVEAAMLAPDTASDDRVREARDLLEKVLESRS
jgi:RNA polymerase sigma-70 factor, ECF subfamily